MTTYNPFYPGGYDDLPATLTPIVSAALNNMDAALKIALPDIITETLAVSQGSWPATRVVSLLAVSFTGAGRLRLYLSAAARTADQTRPAGTLVTTTGLLYEYVADTNNLDNTLPLVIYPGTGATIHWQLDGGPTVALAWVQATK